MADQPGIFRFGVFEVNLATGELRKNGSRVKLQEQPFQVLVALLKRPGEIVTKEELKERLWAGDTFVDFDHSLSTAVNKIREALGDSASSPRFIETVPRRGYRFIGGTGKTSGVPEPVVAAVGYSFPPRRITVWAGAAVAVVALGVLALSRWRSEIQPIRLPAGPLPLTSLPGREENPALSPDGTRVAFSWTGESGDNVDIYVQVLGSSNHMRLTTDAARDTVPTWSPDGLQIAFERRSSTGRAIYLMSPLGGPQTRVAEISDVSGPRSPGIAWAPDGKSIFYAEASSVGHAAIHRLNLRTGEKQPVTFPPAGSGDRHPAVSLDGQNLAFSRGNEISSEIWITRLEDGEPWKLTAQGRTILGFAWTADSREIVFAQESPLGGRLWRVAIDGREPRPMPEVTGYGQFPTISRQGGRLAYEATNSDVNIWSYPLSLNGNGLPARPINPSTRVDNDSQISPDGSRIVFTSRRSGGYEVWLCDRDGSNLQQLTSMGGRTGSPRWSPDGLRVAVDSAQKGNWDIYVVDARGGAPRALTTDEGFDARPSWSRDGRWIYFSSDRGGKGRIWKVPPDGGEAVPVTKGPHDIQPFESPNGHFLYFSRLLKRSELWRVPVDGGEETFAGLTFPLAGGQAQAWAVAESGIFFVEDRETPDLTTKWFLRLLPFSAAEAVDVMEVPPHFGAGGTPLNIAPDGKWFVYSQTDGVSSDLMYLENFE